MRQWLLKSLYDLYIRQPRWVRVAITRCFRGVSLYHYQAPTRPADFAAQLAGMQSPPKFSIVVPLYNTPVRLLKKMVVSVQAQWYPHWTLILVDDGSTKPRLMRALAVLNSPVIHVLKSDHQGISGATNQGIAAATGAFIVFLDHDDELTPDCLWELAQRIQAENPDFIYSDEDKLTPFGRYAQPHFKPDWSPDTMMNVMYTCHVACMRRTVIAQVGGLRSAFDGCQDWDLVLRVSEVTQRISHIPKVLYHWRMAWKSAARHASAKPYTVELSKKLREEALKRRGVAGILETVPRYAQTFRVNYFLTGAPLISMIIPTRDNHACLTPCVQSILQHSRTRSFEIIIVDNGSQQPETLRALQTLSQHPQIKILREDYPFNFSQLNNQGVRQAAGELLLFLNDDTEVITPDWLERMGGYAQQPHIGAVGAKLLYGDRESIQHAGVINLPQGPSHVYLRKSQSIGGYFLRAAVEYNWLAVTGACLMIERQKFEAMGGFDESFPIGYNDMALCFRLHQAGLYQVVCQSVVLVHHESMSRGLDALDDAKTRRLKSELERLYAQYPHYRGYDPFYNSNFERLPFERKKAGFY